MSFTTAHRPPRLHGEPDGRAQDLLDRAGLDDEALVAALSHAPYLRRLAEANQTFFSQILADLSAESFARHLLRWREALEAASSESDLMLRLRKAKQEAALALALADILGHVPLMQTCAILTEFAELSLAACVEYLLRAEQKRGRFGAPDATELSPLSGLIVLAMGKMGAGELNYSSDIDLIIFFDPDRAPLGEGVEPGPFFIALTRKLIKIMQERTAQGYVFRVDLRLRPDPGSTGVAIALPSALIYYESMGQTWERAALIKARPVAGDLEAGWAFLQEVAPFVWRRYLDASVLLDVRALRNKMLTHQGRPDGAGIAERDLKLGQGGIRELEFLVQSKQIMLGGRHPEIRARETLEALSRLSQIAQLPRAEALALGSAYIELRRLEHRVQMQNDEQSHRLPAAEHLEAFARFAGFDDQAALEREVLRIATLISEGYRAFFHSFTLRHDSSGQAFEDRAERDESVALPMENLEPALATFGFAAPEAAAVLVEAWRSRRYRALRSEAAHRALLDMLPSLLRVIGAQDHPDKTLATFDDFLRNLPAGIQLFSLFHANPELLRLMVTLIASAPRLASVIRRKPHVLDGLIDPQEARQSDELLGEVLALDNAESRLDAVRRFVSERQFIAGAHLLGGALNVNTAAKSFTATAQSALQVCLKLAIDTIAHEHGPLKGARVALIALGRLGIGDMTAHSDLDLIMVYESDEHASNHRRSLSASAYFAKIAQRLVANLSAPTSEGSAYAIDFRLRPSGNAGPLAIRFDSFETYQRNEAWTWEHMALTRARPLAGDTDLQNKVSRLIHDVLARKRERESLISEVIAMRKRIAREKPPRGPLDLKQTPGGLIDFEFAIQTLSLSDARMLHPPSLDQGAQVLASAQSLGYISTPKVEHLMQIWSLQRRLHHFLMLMVEGPADEKNLIGGTGNFLASRFGVANMDQLLKHLGKAQKNALESLNDLIVP